MMNNDLFEQMQEDFDYANITDRTYEQNYRTEFVEQVTGFGSTSYLQSLFPWWITTSIVFIVGLALLRLVVKITVDN